MFVGADGSSAESLDAYIAEKGVEIAVVAVSCAGDCAEVEAIATGGRPPYTYAWDDGSTNPARQVCPAANSAFSVQVSDTGTTGEFARPSQTARASVTASILGMCPDSGHAPLEAGLDAAPATCVDPGDAPWSGCVTIGFGARTTGDAPVSEVCDSAPNAPPPIALCLPKPLLAGQTYSLTATFQLGELTGPVPQFSLWGSATSCAESQLFTSQPLAPISPFEGTVTFPACITADAQYDQLRYLVDQQTFSSIASSQFTLQICTGCGGAG
jgi:hypothetical protein